MKKIFLMFVLLLSVPALNGAELFYSDGTSVPIKKAEDLRAVKTNASDVSDQKSDAYSMNTGRYIYYFVSGKKDGEYPVYFLGETPVVAEKTLFWRGERSVEYMEKKYDMKLVEILPTYSLYSFSIDGDSVEIAEKIVKNGDGYAFPDLVRETILNFVPDSSPHDAYFNVQWHLNNTGIGTYHYSNIDIDGATVQNADIKFLQTLEFLNSKNIGVNTNTKIAIMDTGVAPNHEDLTNLDVGWDTLENKEGGYPDSEVSDGVDHGTQCAGVSAGVGNETGMSGVCPWCRIYPVKWLSGHGSTSHLTSDLLTIYEKYAADPNITTINCSFGPQYSAGVAEVYPDEIEAIRNFMQNGRGGKGGVVVYSSGNDNVDSSYKRLLEYDFTFERNGVQVTDRVVTVNASTAWDTIAEYSNFGYASTVAAPSLSSRPIVGIATATIPGYGEYPSAGSDYTRLFSGTSAAAPVVSGLFGVIFSINPNLTLEEAIAILKQSADKINPETGFWDNDGFSVKFGYGRVNLEKAVRLAAGFQMCAEVKDEECGNHIDDDCDGYVDEGCSATLPAGRPCTTDEDCVSGPWTVSDVKCLTEHEAWVFYGGYCFVKSSVYVYSPTYSFAPCPDGTKVLGDMDSEANYYCALECNRDHPCERAGYYCSDEVLGVCLPTVCSDDSDCMEGYFCENSYCALKCGNNRIDKDETCDNGSDNGRTNCDYGETVCQVCTDECRVTAGITSYCGDGRLDTVNGETCDNAFDNGRTNCDYGETACQVCTDECRVTDGITSYCGDGSIDTVNGEFCDDGEENGEPGYCNSLCDAINEIPDSDENSDADVPDADEIPDSDEISDTDVPDADEIPDSDEISDTDVPDADEIPDSDEISDVDIPDAYEIPDIDETSDIDIPDADEIPDSDETSDIDIPDADEIPDIDETSDADIPDADEIPDIDETSDADVPDADEIPDIDETSDADIPDADEIPDIDETSDADIPDADELPDTYEPSDDEEISDIEEISDNNQTPDNEENSDAEVQDSSENSDENSDENKTSADDEFQADDDVADASDSDDTASDINQGELYGECNPDGTCNDGLMCNAKNICVEKIKSRGGCSMLAI